MYKVVICAIFGFSLGAPTVARAQTEIKGVGFESTPVELHDVAQSTRRPITSMDLLTIRDLHGVQISPDGRSVAFVVGQAVYDSNSYRSGLFVVETAPGSVPISLGTAGPPRWDRLGYWNSEPPQWSPDSRYIAYRLLTDGIRQVWRWNRHGSKPIQVTHASLDVESFEWSRDGAALTFVVKKAIPKGTLQRIEEHGVLYDGNTAVFQNRSIMQQELARLPKGTEIWTYNVKSRTERRLSAAEQAERELWKQRLGDRILDIDKWASGDFGNIMDPKLSPDGTKAIFRLRTAPSVSGHMSQPLYLKLLHGGPAIPLNPGGYFVAAYWWSSDSRSIYFSQTSGDGRSPVLFVVSASGGKPMRLSPQTSDVLDEFSADDMGRFAASTLENNTNPASVGLIDLKAGTVRTLVNINPDFINLRLSPAARIEWVSKYGEPGYGYLVKPLDYEPGKHYPLIITTYTSGDYFLRGGGGDEYPIQVFAANGFAVLAWAAGPTPEPPKEGNFEEAMRRLRWPLASLEAALSVLDQMDIIDAKRRGLTGYSYGTEITDFTISHSDLFQAAVACSMSIHNPYFYYMAPKWWKQNYREWGLGGWPEGEASNHWHEISSALNAERIHAPFLSNASEDDFMVAFQLYTTLEQLGKPVELFIYPNELHTKVQPKHRFEIYERNVDWFKFWLQSREEPDPKKKAQYERWRHLRELHEKDMNQ